jgi:hypothetical protein
MCIAYMNGGERITIFFRDRRVIVTVEKLLKARQNYTYTVGHYFKTL